MNLLELMHVTIKFHCKFRNYFYKSNKIPKIIHDFTGMG